MPTDLVKITCALISVSDKTGIESFARSLAASGVQIISTGGTARALADAGIAVTTIEEFTGFPEMLDGRVKTLHPKVHGGLLGIRDNPQHAAAMEAHGIVPIDLVCVNLYPFEETVARPGVARHEAIENIDIGGPSMIRSAAKNHAFVTVLTSPRQYAAVLAEMEITDGCTSLSLRCELAAAAFERTASYDRAIHQFLCSPPGANAARTGGPKAASDNPSLSPMPAAGAMPTGAFPDALGLAYPLHQRLRYGENPHQMAAVYQDPDFTGPSVVSARQLHGKQLSYNNLHDAAAALELASHLSAFAGPEKFACCCIKHANPCGAAVGRDGQTAVDRAIACDPVATFGGIMACSWRLDAASAQRLCGKDIFLEVLIAPDFEPDALEILRARWQNLRLLAVSDLSRTPPKQIDYRSIPGGMLTQERDVLAPRPEEWAHKAGPIPTRQDLAVAAQIEIMVRAMSSNAVAIGGRDGKTVRLFGAGLGQVDRVGACRLAVAKAGLQSAGAVAVSDAFFPFADGPEILINAGVKMLVHAGGSKRDSETFDLCQKHGVTCMVTGVRRFRH